MRFDRRVLALLSLLVLFGCPPSPIVPGPDGDAQPAPAPAIDAPAPSGPCADACAALASVGCPEGRSPTCVTTLTHEDADRLVRTPAGAPLTCAAVARVTTPAAARAAGVACPTP